MSHYIGAIDQGTTSTRFIIFDEQGDVISLARKEHRQICPQPGWVEHDPMEILRNTVEVCANALAQAKLEAKNLAAVGLANQRETTLLWNRQTGRPYGNAVVWMDTRTAGLAKEYVGTAGRLRFQQQTGLPISTYFPSLKLRWLFDQDKDLARAAESGEALFGTIDSWLVWNLTGGDRNALHITDVTNASRTQLMNLRTCQWDDDLLNQFGIPLACLPEIRPSASLHDIIESGPLQGVPLAGILGDQQAALVGQTCFGPGAMKATYGTGTFLLLNTGSRPVFSGAGLLATVAYQLAEAEPVYALEGAIAMTGGVVQWLRDNLGLIHQVQEIEILANCAEDNGDVYFVPAFSGLYAPYWREDARGIIAGLTWHSTRAHIVRRRWKRRLIRLEMSWIRCRARVIWSYGISRSMAAWLEMSG